MQTIAIVSQKGGVGKTTLAIHLAVAATHAGINTAVIDLDPQASSAKWADRRQVELPVVISSHVRIPRQSCHRFQANPATDSTAKLPPVPHESCH